MDFPTKLCAKHREALKLLCQEDQRCICMVCHAIQLHTPHRLPRDEAVQDRLDKLSTQLTFLKTEKEEALETKLSGEQEIQGMLNLVSVEMQKVANNFNKMQEFLKDQEKSLVLQMEELNRDITEWKEQFTTQLSKKVSYLSNLMAELEEQHWNPVLKLPEDTGNLLHRAEMPMVKNFKPVLPELRDRIQHLCGKSWVLQRSMKRFTECLQSELEKRKVVLTLDPDTANPHLFISPDQKTVSFRESPQKLPYSAERFDSHFCVLGQEAFSSGKHCWEVCVGVGSMEGWAVGVSRASGRRKGEVSFVPSEGIWAIQMLKGCYEALTSPETPLTLHSPPERLEVSLDYERGSLTFSDAETGTLIFAFSVDFCGEILPFFWLWGQGAQLTVIP
ncbi:E3 ubiquitin-protein ligase TRIM7 [Sarcophilus harrisii]|uniref:B30.2/SPRY domain-containing protein n=1 Tax=Sarcophilus harrisii TaxID=9305 RepID=A0A7N4PUF7_SARHA|nr:E3 ubiquitin-protein ligase TRIM7 [Sarcophilus harrisii]XP_031806264.1 E3 ubiquitin-protein ligase TRIM7 [Sarcophilus harrisii]